jgi:hypothetical protein
MAEHDTPRGPTLRVVGAGFGRTGTTSMKLALDQLGLGPAHHMFEAFDHPEVFDEWAAAVRGEPWDRELALAGFRSSLDFPSCVVWEELWRANPGSTVLLTTRSSESWWRSFDATIAPGLRADAGGDGAHGALFAAIEQEVFGGRSDDRDTAIAAFEAHQQHVLDTVPADQLVVHHVGDGWGPICEHFGLAVPDGPFPSSNSTEDCLAGQGRPSTP